eukprot:scaffold5653_cov136-Isochrysis_galbana.AAC.4
MLVAHAVGVERVDAGVQVDQGRHPPWPDETQDVRWAGRVALGVAAGARDAVALERDGPLHVVAVPSEGEKRRVACDHEERRRRVGGQQPTDQRGSAERTGGVLDHPNVGVVGQHPRAVPADQLAGRDDGRVECDLRLLGPLDVRVQRREGHERVGPALPKGRHKGGRAAHPAPARHVEYVASFGAGEPQAQAEQRQYPRLLHRPRVGADACSCMEAAVLVLARRALSVSLNNDTDIMATAER